MSKHKCTNHDVREIINHPIYKNWKTLYCYDCEREFTGKYVWKGDNRKLVERKPDITQIF